MTNEITKRMTIVEVVGRWPQTTIIFQQAGMHCVGCALASGESIEMGAMAHGIKNIDTLIKKLNKSIQGDE